MEDSLISKKDLLDLTGISYGQLYRWKRKKLIPEDWFIKKSSFTGQETFFPKEKILDRIDKIVNMKDDLSLDEIADMFAPNAAKIILNSNDLKEKGIVTDVTLSVYRDIHGDEEVFSFDRILFMYVIDIFVKSGDVSIDECKTVLNTIEKNYRSFKDKDYDIVLLRKFGAAICILLLAPNELYIEDYAKLVLKVNILKCVEELKIKVFK